MLGLEIGKNDRSSVYNSSSAFFGLLSVVLGIWIGPIGIFSASTLGVISAIWAFLRSPKSRFPLILIGIHVSFIGLGVVLQMLFLSPLSSLVQKIPPLQHRYHDPGGVFQVRGPVGWQYEDLGSTFEAGVRIRPVLEGQYMGISEILVHIRELENKPKSHEEFLKKMALQWSEKPNQKGQTFDFSIEPTELLNKDNGLWSILDVKRFWVPVRHLTLLGLKNKLYLCSVSAVGLKSHATLSRVACLGIFETIKILDKEK